MLYMHVTKPPLQQVSSLSRSLLAFGALAKNQTSKGEWFYEHFCMFLQAMFSTEEQRIKRYPVAETKVKKLFLIPCFVLDIIFA